MLNTQKIRSLKPRSGPYRVADNGPCNGLDVHVSAKGYKSFSLSRRTNGKKHF